MTNNVKIKRQGHYIYVSSEYSEYFIKESRKQNASWNKEAKAWVYEDDREEYLKNILLESYDYDMTNSMKLYDVIIDLDKFNLDADGHKKRSLRFNGLAVVYRAHRDSEVEFGNNFNVYLENGGFASRGGSSQYPAIEWEEGTKVLVKGVSEYTFEKSLKDKAGVEIVEIKEAINKNNIDSEEELKKELADIQEQIKELKAKEKELKAKLKK